MLMLKEQTNWLLIRWIFEISRTHFKLTAQMTNILLYFKWGWCDGDHMIVGFTTTYVINAYPHLSFEFESHSWRSTNVYIHNTTLCDKVCQWLAASQWFSLRTQISSTNKTDRHDITEILLKVALITITLNSIFYISSYSGNDVFQLELMRHAYILVILGSSWCRDP